MFKLTEIFSESKAAEIKEHFFSLRFLFDAGNIRTINRMQRLMIWIHEALVYDRLDILSDFLEEIRVAVHRLSARCVNFRNKEGADEEAKRYDYEDWVNFLKRYAPCEDISDEGGRRLRIGDSPDSSILVSFSYRGVFEEIKPDE